jgi:DNA-binding transcriptional LysR family regulator
MIISTSMRRLEVFLAVAETGRFSQAAERLGIAQPSVSAHISGLERQVGQSLFLRTPGRPPVLSQAGKSLLTYATDVLRKSHETADTLKSMSPAGAEELTIAAQRCVANHLLPPLLTEFVSANPNTKMTMNSEIQENVISLISENRADIGLFLGLQRVSGLPSEIVGYQKLAIVVSPDHELAKRERVSPDQLQRFPFLGGLPSSNFAKLIDTVLRKMGVRDQQYVLRLQDATALTAVARRGIGIHCTPLCNVEADIKAGLLKQVPVTVPPMALQIRLAFRPSEQMSGAAHRFAAFLRSSNAWAGA